MNKIKSFEEACEKLGRSTELPDVSTFPENMRKSIIAFYKLTIITEVVNDGWEPDSTDNRQRKWFPAFSIDEMGSGLAYAYGEWTSTSQDVSLGYRLCLSSEEAADHVGETFTDLWEDWML